MKKNLKFIIIGIAMVALILGYYYYVSNKTTVNDIEESTTEISYVNQLLSRSFDKDYPPTPREVLKAYADITCAFYTQEYDDDQFNKLGLKLLDLYDEDLKAANPTEEYLRALKAEVMKFKGEGMSFSSYATGAATDVIYYDYDGRKCARLNIAFTVKQGTNAGITKETFVMRKDESGHWKILGWALAKDDSN